MTRIRGRGPDPSLPPPDLLGPDEELVAGRRPVEEVFAAGRTAHRLLVVPHRRNALEQLVLHATRLRIPIVEVEGGSLTAIAGFDGHQGVAVVVEPRQFATIDDILARARERDEPPFVLVLDSLEDPQNLGTLLRSAEAAGVHGVVFPTRRQAPLSAAAVKASAGATEHLLLCPVDDLPGALADLHAHGLRIAGSEADAPLTARQTDLRGPLAIVVGSEGQGLGPGHPATLRPVHADPDARRDRVAQCRRRRVRPPVRGGRPARPGSARRRPPNADADHPNPRPPRRTRSTARRAVAAPEPAAANEAAPRRARRPATLRSRLADEDLLPGGPPAEPRPETTEAAGAAHPPRLTHQRERPYHSPAPGGVSCGMSLRVAPT